MISLVFNAYPVPGLGKRGLAVIFLAFFVFDSRAVAKDETQTVTEEIGNFEYSVKKSKSGLTFRVPEDMPIETRNGIEAPMPFDEYVFAKFQKMEKRLEQMENTLAQISLEVKTLKSSEKKLTA